MQVNRTSSRKWFLCYSLESEINRIKINFAR